jgi:hypothetical protein
MNQRPIRLYSTSKPVPDTLPPGHVKIYKYKREIGKLHVSRIEERTIIAAGFSTGAG